MAITGQKYKVIHDLMLHEAANAGDEFKLAFNMNYVKRGKMDINFKDEEYGDRTALHCAAEEGKLNLIYSAKYFVVILWNDFIG